MVRRLKFLDVGSQRVGILNIALFQLLRLSIILVNLGQVAELVLRPETSDLHLPCGQWFLCFVQHRSNRLLVFRGLRSMENHRLLGTFSGTGIENSPQFFDVIGFH